MPRWTLHQADPHGLGTTWVISPARGRVLRIRQPSLVQKQRIVLQIDGPNIPLSYNLDNLVDYLLRVSDILRKDPSTVHLLKGMIETESAAVRTPSSRHEDCLHFAQIRILGPVNQPIRIWDRIQIGNQRTQSVAYDFSVAFEPAV